MSLIDKNYVFDCPLTVNMVFERIMSVSKNIKGLSFNSNPQPYTVLLRGRTSFWSWGENVTIACQPLDDYHTRVSIKSVPVVPTTLVDWGKGSKNVNNVLAALRTVLPVPQR